jgi:DNA topoisomerase VI subunit B
VFTANRLELLTICEHIKYGERLAKKYYENYSRKMRANPNTFLIKRLVDELEYIINTFNRISIMLCNTDAISPYNAFDEADKLYTRIIGLDFMPSEIRAMVYEIRYEIKKLL